MHGAIHRSGGPDSLEGPWQYVTPLSPADTPNDFRDSGVSFENGWENLSGYPAAAFRRSLGGLRLQLHVTGDEGTPGSTIFTLPSAFRPTLPYRLFVQVGAAGDGIGTIQVNSDGTVVFVGQLAI